MVYRIPQFLKKIVCLFFVGEKLLKLISETFDSLSLAHSFNLFFQSEKKRVLVGVVGLEPTTRPL